MLKKIVTYVAAATILLLASACMNQTPNETNKPSNAPIELNISAALGLKEALLDIQKDYESNHPNVKLVYNLAAAGVLQSQIEQGAPADVFISAANNQVDALAKKNLVNPASRRSLVSNELVLIIPKNSPLEINGFQDLDKPGVIHYGLGEPQTVPAGQYGVEVLKKLGIWEKVQNKAVLAKDVRAILSYVETGDAEAGIVFSTVAATSDKVKIVATAPKDSHEPIVFPGVVLTNSKHPEAAQDFLDYLTSPEGMKVFKKYGFTEVQ
ncbi:MAG: molybdenum transporter, periplasmic molybdate-binding protein [Firmicutes bacterium]|nr:molybdenum transporter, periplasmic molybdate-binding protein [Bacillota bacterium]